MPNALTGPVAPPAWALQSSALHGRMRALRRLARRDHGLAGRHHHLACDACGRLVDLDDGVVPPLRIPESSRTGFQIKDYSVSFTGLCPDCAKKKS